MEPTHDAQLVAWSKTVMADELLFTNVNKIATITLNRPDQLNTFHDGMLADWAAALRECQADDAINVVVLTAAGRVFCAGGVAIRPGIWGTTFANTCTRWRAPLMPCISRTFAP